MRQPPASSPRDGVAEIRGLALAWREWGPVDAPPVIALHGWLDNAASFDALGPLLHDVRLIAVDAPGHGRSAHRPAASSYNIWDDLPDLLALTHELGLGRYRLLGHSRGAAIAALLAAVDNEHVESLALLDGAPPLSDPAQALDQLRRFVTDFGVREPRPPRAFASVGEAIEARCRASGIDARAAAMLVPRGLRHGPAGYSWCADPRLRYASALKLDAAQLAAIMAGVTMPVLLCGARGGMDAQLREVAAGGWFARLEYHTVDGCHHGHMLEPSQTIARHLRDFWRTHGSGH